jgi:hypothetical protein
MDVSDILSKHAENQYALSESSSSTDNLIQVILHRKSVTVDKEIPLHIDAGLLAVTDLNPIDQGSYEYMFFFTIATY